MASQNTTLVRPSHIPQHLHDGDLYKSLDVSSDEEFEVPADTLKPDLTVNSVSELNHALASLSYWLVAEIPFEIIDFLWSHSDTTVDEKYVEPYPYLKLLPQLPRAKNDEERFKLTISFGSLYIVKYLLRRGYKLKNTSNACIVAARAGHISILQYFHEQGARLHVITCKAAFISGNMVCLEYMRLHGLMNTIQGQPLRLHGSFYPDPEAVFVPDLLTLRYAVDQGCVMNDRLMYTAAELGRLDVLQYTYEQGCSWGDMSASTRAAEFGHLHCLQYAVEHGCAYNYRALCEAATHGHLQCMVYLHEKGCVWSEEVFYFAAAYGRLECLKYAHAHGCPANNMVYRIVRLKKLTEVAQYMEEHGITCEDVNNEFP